MKNVMTRAWQIAKAAATETGKKASLFFREALKMAWAEAKAPTEKSVNTKLAKAGISATARAWGDTGRIYININVNNGVGFRGDRNTKVWIDANGINIKKFNGLFSDEWKNELNKIIALFDK